jgi:hypothetical protein
LTVKVGNHKEPFEAVFVDKWDFFCGEFFTILDVLVLGIYWKSSTNVWIMAKQASKL